MRGRLVLVLLAALAAREAGAREWRVTLGGGGTRVEDPGALIVQDSGWLSGFDVGAQVEIGLGAFAGLRIGGQGTEAGDLFDQGRSSLHALDLLATGRWQVRVLEWLRPFVEVGAGASQVNLGYGGAGLDEDRWVACLAGEVGLELRLPPEWLFGGSFTLGLDLSGGYVWRSGADFAADGTELGALDLHGAGWRLGVAAIW